jgi:hypothetical protein
MRRSRRLGVAFIVTICAPLAITAQSQVVSSPVGQQSACYQLTLGTWSGALPATGMPQAQTPPAHFRLDTVVAAGNAAWFSVEPGMLVERSRMLASWKPVLGDSLTIYWSTGFVGVTLRLAVRGDSLLGSATTFHDAHGRGEPPDPTADVVAVREPCPRK